MDGVAVRPLSWWASPALRDDREAFYIKASIEAERMQQSAKQTSPYTTAIGDRGDYWKKPKAEYHDEAAEQIRGDVMRISYSDDEEWPGQFALWDANCRRSLDDPGGAVQEGAGVGAWPVEECRMTRRDRAVRHALDKLAIAERYAREARAVFTGESYDDRQIGAVLGECGK